MYKLLIFNPLSHPCQTFLFDPYRKYAILYDVYQIFNKIILKRDHRLCSSTNNTGYCEMKKRKYAGGTVMRVLVELFYRDLKVCLRDIKDLFNITIVLEYVFNDYNYKTFAYERLSNT